jgi:hypothetical protein
MKELFAFQRLLTGRDYIGTKSTGGITCKTLINLQAQLFLI